MSENALFDRMRELSQIFDDMDMKCVAANYHQEDAFLGTLPLCKVPESLFALGHRNMLTFGAASIYPFASYELMDDNGILMGLNLSNGSLVMPDVFDTSRYKNPHMFIVGSSGAGKTYNMLVQALHTRLSGTKPTLSRLSKAESSGEAARPSAGSLSGSLRDLLTISM